MPTDDDILAENRRILEGMIGFPRTAKTILDAAEVQRDIGFVRVEHPRMVALSLLALVQEHRTHCPGEACWISLSLLLPIYEALVGRELTPEERVLFA